MTVISISQPHQPTPCDDRTYDGQKIGTKKYPAVKRGIVEGFCNAVTFYAASDFNFGNSGFALRLAFVIAAFICSALSLNSQS